MKQRRTDLIWGLTRIVLGCIFLWSFLDKLFGLGYTTCRNQVGAVAQFCDQAWVKGGSPTTGFLKTASVGSPIEQTLQSMAGDKLWDWVFMIGLAGIGIAMILGIGIRIAALSGVIMMAMIYLALYPPTNNPILDEHVVYALLFIGLAQVNDTQALGFGKVWSRSRLVSKYRFLE
ncbi:DoxX family membrane protein [Candidatus Saccharibacteria bacterium]|nr:DoxX family membrane protein [Candidatus Saccharibacteria bacterium]